MEQLILKQGKKEFLVLVTQNLASDGKLDKENIFLDQEFIYKQNTILK